MIDEAPKFPKEELQSLLLRSHEMGVVVGNSPMLGWMPSSDIPANVPVLGTNRAASWGRCDAVVLNDLPVIKEFEKDGRRFDGTVLITRIHELGKRLLDLGAARYLLINCHRSEFDYKSATRRRRMGLIPVPETPDGAFFTYQGTALLAAKIMMILGNKHLILLGMDGMSVNGKRRITDLTDKDLASVPEVKPWPNYPTGQWARRLLKYRDEHYPDVRIEMVLPFGDPVNSYDGAYRTLEEVPWP